MAKAEVKMVCAECGREYVATKICNNRREADSWEAWMLGQKGCCRECYAKRMAAKREAERRARESEVERNFAALPALVGSEKQIAWAMHLRSEMIDKAFDTPKAIEQLNAEGRAVLSVVLARRTEAHWWIENRDSAEAVKALREEIEAESAKQLSGKEVA